MPSYLDFKYILNQSEAGKKVYQRFVKGKSSLNKYQHNMIRDMAYFEALFNEMLKDEKFIKNKHTINYLENEFLKNA